MQVLVALLGLGAGVLVNALADGLPLHRRVEVPACHACGAPRPPLAWSGLVAWLSRRWRCAYCGTSRPWRAPVVEAVSTLAASWLYGRDPSPTAFLPGVLVFTIFLLIIVIDIEHRLILHVVSGSAALIIGLLSAFTPGRGLEKTLLGGLAGFVIVFGLYYLGGLFGRFMARLRGQELEEVAFGFGDVTLSGVIGLTVGWPGVVVALFLGILLAGGFSVLYVIYMLLRRRFTFFTPIPYGPFLILGALVVYFGGRTAFEGLLGG